MSHLFCVCGDVGVGEVHVVVSAHDVSLSVAGPVTTV
jgi:hypothetical protein